MPLHIHTCLVGTILFFTVCTIEKIKQVIEPIDGMFNIQNEFCFYRKSAPYDAYDLVDFDIPVGTNGDCYDRCCIDF